MKSYKRLSPVKPSSQPRASAAGNSNMTASHPSKRLNGVSLKYRQDLLPLTDLSKSHIAGAEVSRRR